MNRASYNDLSCTCLRQNSKATALDLFKTLNMLKKTLVQMYVWFTASFVYYGLTLNGDILIPGEKLRFFGVNKIINIFFLNQRKFFDMSREMDLILLH